MADHGKESSTPMPGPARCRSKWPRSSRYGERAGSPLRKKVVSRSMKSQQPRPAARWAEAVIDRALAAGVNLAGLEATAAAQAK